MRRAFVGPFGIIGDRRHAALDADGVPLSARRAHALLGFGARYDDGEAAEGASVTTPSGLELAWDDPGVAEELSIAIGRPARLVRSAVGIHDAAPLHIVSTSSLAAAADWTDGEIDRRRFRANIVVELDRPEPFAESDWMGTTLDLGPGGPLIEVVSPTERCAITTFDPDTLERDNRVLAGLARERENLFGVYARVVRAGWAEVGRSIVLAATAAHGST